MVSFDLTEILNNSNISVDLRTVQDFTYALQKDIQTFMGNIPNLTVGLTPDEGVSIPNLPEAASIRSFITDALVMETTTLNIHCSQVYRDHVFETLIATGYIPVGWICQNANNLKVAHDILGQLRNTWNLVISDYLGCHAQRDLIYTKAKAFGLMVKDTTMGRKKLLWYLVTTNQQDCDFVQLWARDNKITNLVTYNENDYERAVVDSTNRFLFHFDRIMDPYAGVVFRAKLNIKNSIPTYLAMIGCDLMCVIDPGTDRSDYQMVTTQYVVREYKRSQAIETIVRVPSDFTIDFVALNGTPYFVDTYAMAAAGIEVIPMDTTTLTGYSMYKVIVSGQDRTTQIYIDACQDFTGVGFSRKVISTAKSTITVSDTGVAFNIVFNFPFIFFNTDKIHVFARKDCESREEEVLIKQVIVADKKYAEKRVTFGTTSSNGTYPLVETENSAVQYPKPSCGYPYPHIHHRHPDGFRENPDIIHCLPPYTQTVGNGASGIMDTTPESRVMMFGVSESGSIVVTFDGYIDYKYFRVEFDDRTMIVIINDNEIIPVIEKFNITNPTVTTGCETPTNPDDNIEGDGNETPTEPDETNKPSDGEGDEVNDASGNDKNPDDTTKPEGDDDHSGTGGIEEGEVDIDLD